MILTQTDLVLIGVAVLAVIVVAVVVFSRKKSDKEHAADQPAPGQDTYTPEQIKAAADSVTPEQVKAAADALGIKQ